MLRSARYTGDMLVLDGLLDAGERVHLRRSAAIETCLALWVARAPEREPLAANARRLEALLPAWVARDTARLDRSRAAWPLELLTAFYRLGLDDIDEAIDLVNDRGLDTFRSDQRGMMLVTLAHFWRAGFATIWQRERRLLERQADELSDRLRDRPGPTLAALSPRAVLDRSGDRLKIHHDGVPLGIASCAHLDAIDVIPSMWLRRRVVVGAAGRRIGLCIARPQAELIDPSPDRLAGALAVLAVPRRLHMLLLCMSQPRTTRGLAKLMGVSEPQISRHLQELKRHGLVVARRDGRYILYRGVPEEVALVSAQLRGQLSESLALDELVETGSEFRGLRDGAASAYPGVDLPGEGVKDARDRATELGHSVDLDAVDCRFAKSTEISLTHQGGAR